MTICHAMNATTQIKFTEPWRLGTGVGNPKAVRALRFALKYVPPTIILEYEVVPSKSRRHLTLTIAKLTPKKDPYGCATSSALP